MGKTTVITVGEETFPFGFNTLPKESIEFTVFEKLTPSLFEPGSEFLNEF